MTLCLGHRLCLFSHFMVVHAQCVPLTASPSFKSLGLRPLVRVRQPKLPILEDADTLDKSTKLFTEIH